VEVQAVAIQLLTAQQAVAVEQVDIYQAVLILSVLHLQLR
jgi:hypothetical protein